MREALDDVTAALENCLVHHGESMSHHDLLSRTKLCEDARELLGQVEYATEEEEEACNERIWRLMRNDAEQVVEELLCRLTPREIREEF